MQERPLSPALVVGSVATAATTGALVAFGHRMGNIGLPFNAIGALIVHPVVGVPMRVVLTGLVLHAGATLLWSVICVNIARVLARRFVAAGLVATTQFIVSWIVALWTGNGLASLLPLGDRVVYSVVFAGALAVGMRFAFSASRNVEIGARTL